jgi:hypothetical protein
VEADDVTGTTATRWILKLGAGLLGAGVALAAGGAEPAPLGIAYDEVPGQPRALESAGRPLLSGDLVKAVNQGAVVRLENGRVLRLASNSSAVLERGTAGEVRVTVLSGRVAMVGESGRPLVAGQRSRFTVRPAARDAEAAEAQLLSFDLDVLRHREEREGTAHHGRIQGDPRR